MRAFWRRLKLVIGITPDSLFDSVVYVFANCGKFCVYVSVGKAKNFQPVGGQNCCPFDIVGKSLLFIVLRAVDFDDQFCFCTEKVNDKTVNRNLPAKPKGILIQKIIPKMPLLRCCIFPQRLGFSGVFWIVLTSIANRSCPCGAPSPKGRAFLFIPFCVLNKPSPLGKVARRSRDGRGEYKIIISYRLFCYIMTLQTIKNTVCLGQIRNVGGNKTREPHLRFPQFFSL